MTSSLRLSLLMVFVSVTLLAWLPTLLLAYFAEGPPIGAGLLGFLLVILTTYWSTRVAAHRRQPPQRRQAIEAGIAGFLGTLAFPLLGLWPYLLVTQGREAMTLPLFTAQPAIVGAIGAVLGVSRQGKRDQTDAQADR